MQIPDLKPKLNEAFGWEPVPDGCLIYSLDSTQMLTLNPMAELILTYCDGSTSLPQIFQELRAEATLDEAEFVQTIETLLKEKVLIPSEP